VIDSATLASLIETVGAFYVRDKRLMRVQQTIEAALVAGPPSDAQVTTYLAEVRRYFSAFDGEAKAQLKRVDRELERLFQVQYNLTAERSVAARRVEATQGVLSSLAEIGAR